MTLPDEFTLTLARPVALQGLERAALTFRKDGDAYALELPEVPDELTIPLRKPITIGGVTLTHLELREPTEGEIEKAFVSGNDLHKTKMLISIVSKQAPPFIEALPARDFKRASEYIQNFL